MSSNSRQGDCEWKSLRLTAIQAKDTAKTECFPHWIGCWFGAHFIPYWSGFCWSCSRACISTDKRPSIDTPLFIQIQFELPRKYHCSPRYNRYSALIIGIAVWWGTSFSPLPTHPQRSLARPPVSTHAHSSGESVLSIASESQFPRTQKTFPEDSLYGYASQLLFASVFLLFPTA